MAELHEALQSLAPLDWDEVPKDNLEKYIEQLAEASEIVCNSVPAPPNGTSFEDSTTEFSQANEATAASETKASTVRAPPPSAEHEALQSHWGKPIKFSAKDNPFNISVYKTAGRDRHGAWFARRSVHEGIGYTKFCNAMKQELPTTLAVKGGPGVGSVRGIAADQRLEQFEVGDSEKLEVYQMSAQFPGPTTPREFITMLVTSERPARFSSSHQGRQLMVISKPLTHPDAPDRPGHIRGKYESVEMIREIPLHLRSSKPQPDSPSTDTLASTADAGVAELNPVEWIMVTRSDPGGGIPRFMVDRGTPSTMLSDVTKFLDWATKYDGAQETPSQKADSVRNGSIDKASDPIAPKPSEINAANITEEPSKNGVLRQFTNAVEAGLDAYAPAMVSSFVHERFDPAEPVYASSDSSAVSSTISFASAAELHEPSDYPVAADDSSIAISSLSVDSDMKKDQGAPGSSTDKNHEKELQKIKAARDKLEQRLAKKRQEEYEKLKKSQDNENSESTKALERHDKEIKKHEERHKKEVDKLEAKHQRELKKYEEKKRKQNDRSAMQKVIRERDDFRSQVDLLKRENAILRERIDNLEGNSER